jgi:hypothetical protein
MLILYANHNVLSSETKSSGAGSRGRSGFVSLALFPKVTAFRETGGTFSHASCYALKESKQRACPLNLKKLTLNVPV